MTRHRRPVESLNGSHRRRGGGAGEPAAHPVPPGAGIHVPTYETRLLIDSREVARLLGVGRTKTFQMMASGELPTVRIGRSVRVSLAGLHSWIDKQVAARTRDDRRLLYRGASELDDGGR